MFSSKLWKTNYSITFNQINVGVKFEKIEKFAEPPAGF